MEYISQAQKHKQSTLPQSISKGAQAEGKTSLVAKAPCSFTIWMQAFLVLWECDAILFYAGLLHSWFYLLSADHNLQTFTAWVMPESNFMGKSAVMLPCCFLPSVLLPISCSTYLADLLNHPKILPVLPCCFSALCCILSAKILDFRVIENWYWKNLEENSLISSSTWSVNQSQSGCRWCIRGISQS